MEKHSKADYLAPMCQLVRVSETSYLMDTSFSTTQHRPANHGSTISSAKASMSCEEDEEEDDENPSWED